MKLASLLPYAVTGAAAALVASILPLLSSSTQAAPKLLPFQGRLTDASGNPVADGAKVVQFQIFNAPTGGTAVWNGEVQKVTVNGGLVSTLLGSKADLSGVDFNQALYLEITVDANADDQITAADPPLLPRQSILPAVFAVEAQSARDSQKLGGFDWSAFFDNGNPATGKISGGKLADASVTTAQLAANAVTTAKLANASVTTAQLGANAVTTTQIAPGAVTPSQLSSGVAYSIIPPGSIIAFGGAGDAVPAGWLLCDGRAVSRATYPGLYGYIGTYWGFGDGSTTFTLPDFRGRFLRGVDDSPLTGIAGRDPDRLSRSSPGTTDANSRLVGSSQGDELKSHQHVTFYKSATNLYGTEANAGENIDIGASSGSFPKSLVKAAGGSETRPKNAYVFYIIKY